MCGGDPKRNECHNALGWVLWFGAGCICWNGPGTSTIVSGNINAEKYRAIFNKYKWTLAGYCSAFSTEWLYPTKWQYMYIR